MTLGNWVRWQLSLPEKDRGTVKIDGGHWKAVGEQNGRVLLERVGSYYGPGNPMYDAITEIMVENEALGQLREELRDESNTDL